jgi:putative two-component system response regulator
MGYPDGLAGEEIPLGARIVAVADTFDALTSVRPYRPASRPCDALDLLSIEAGDQLDPAVVSAFESHYSGLRAVLLRALAR